MVGMNNTRSRPFGVADAPNPQQWVGPRAACQILNVSTASLYRLVDAGLVVQYQPETGNSMYWRAALEALKEERRRRG